MYMQAARRGNGPMASIVAFAVVDHDGTLLHSENVDKIDHSGPGRYDIYFSVPTTAQVASFADPRWTAY